MVEVLTEPGKACHYKTAAFFKMTAGGFEHSFLFLSKNYKLLSCSVEKSLVEKCFTTGGFDTDVLAVFQNVDIWLNEKCGGFTRQKAKWELCAADKGDKYIAPVLSVTSAGGGKFDNSDFEFAQICYFDSKVVRISGNRVASKYKAPKSADKFPAHVQTNSLVLEVNCDVEHRQHAAGRPPASIKYLKKFPPIDKK